MKNQSFFNRIFLIAGALILLPSTVVFACVNVSRLAENEIVTSSFEWRQSPATSSESKSSETQMYHVNEITSGYHSKDLQMEFDVCNLSDSVVTKILYFDSPLMGKLSVHKMVEGQVSQQTTGPGFSLSERSYPSRLGAIKLELAPHQKIHYLINHHSHHAVHAQAYVASPSFFENQENQARLIFYFYLGGILSLILYNLTLSLSTRQIEYLIYSIFASCFAMTVLCVHNILDSYLLPVSGFVWNDYLMTFSSLALMTGSVFVRRFLGIEKTEGWPFWGTVIVGSSSVPALIASFFVPHFPELWFMGYWIDIAILIGVPFFLVCGLYRAFIQRDGLAFSFLFSWGAVLSGVVIWLASTHGYMKSSSWTQYSLVLANLAEMLILSLGLAYKLRFLDLEQRRARLATQEKNRYHRLVKVLSHDVANAVNALNFHVQSFDPEAPVPELTKTHYFMKSQLERLKDVLQNVRNEEGLGRNRTLSELSWVSVRDCCDESARFLQWELSQKEVLLDLQVPSDAEVYVDRGTFVQQVMVNLISNAIKFSYPHGHIRIQWKKGPEFNRLVIRDEGVGLTSQQSKELFCLKTPAFSRRGTSDEAGTGLGSKLIAEYMALFGGRIEVSSDGVAGRGTSIALLLPTRSEISGG